MICLTIILRIYDSYEMSPWCSTCTYVLQVDLCGNPLALQPAIFRCRHRILKPNLSIPNPTKTSGFETTFTLEFWTDFFCFEGPGASSVQVFFCCLLYLPKWLNLRWKNVAFQPPVQAMESFAKKHQDKVFRLALEDGVLRFWGYHGCWVWEASPKGGLQ